MSAVPASGSLSWLRLPWRRAATAATSSVVDAPTDRDLLGYRTLADPVARHILSLQINQTPLTIGIYGQWGSGKTSFLRMVDSVLSDGGVKPIWFHAWKYEREDNLWAALIQTIVGQGTVSGSWLAKVIAKMKLAWRRVRLSAISGELGGAAARIIARGLFIIVCALVIVQRDELAPLLSPLFGAWAPDAAAAVAAIAAIVAAKPETLLSIFSAKIGVDVMRYTETPSYRAHIAFLDDFTNELREIVRIAGGGKPVVIVIDDLDRCLPEKALQVIEAMKMFLDVEGAVFLFAVERDIIQQAVAYKYRGTRTDPLTVEERVAVAAMADSYLEKLIHLSFTLMPLRSEDIEQLVEGVSDPETARWSKLFAVGLPPNPRTVKRTLQMFVFMKQLAESKLKSGEMTESLLAKMIVIHEQCREIYGDLPRFPTLLAEMEKTALDAQYAIADTTLGDRVNQLLGRYPRLRALVSFGGGVSESFIDVDVQPYLRLLRSVQRAAPVSAPPPAAAEAAPQVTPTFPGLKPFSAVDTPAFPIRMRKPDGTVVPYDASVLLPDDRVFLKGPGGSGKSTLLRIYARHLAHRRAEDHSEPRTPRPILLSLLDLPTLSTSGIVSAILASSPDTLAAMKAGDCCLLIDGLDEAPARDLAVRAIADVVSLYPTNRYVIATRPIMLDTTALRGFVDYEILPLTDDDIASYALSLGEGKVSHAAVAAIIERGLGRSPLLLQLALQHLPIEGPLDAGALMRFAIDAFVDRIQRHGPDFSPAVARRLLIGMAKMSVLNRMVVEPDALHIASQMGLSEADASRYLEALSERGGVGILTMPRPGSYRFMHDAIHEALSQME